jgi:hypothetical protein
MTRGIYRGAAETKGSIAESSACECRQDKDFIGGCDSGVAESI